MNCLDIKDIELNQLSAEICETAGVELYIARFDAIHPIVSGNKLFKLHFFLQEAVARNLEVVTYGGPFSNHLIATAFACKEMSVQCTGVVNGEQHELTHTLKECMSLGMQLKFILRKDYAVLKYGPAHHHQPEAVIIPEGGYHPLGARGAALMPPLISKLTPTHTCISAGTATTLAGFLKTSHGKIIAVPAIKNMTDIECRLEYLGAHYEQHQLEIWPEYHFGGFAKVSTELISFMKKFRAQFGIELDRVYTAKMMYAVMEEISSGYFERGSRIVCVHTGGLQGNSTLAQLQDP